MGERTQCPEMCFCSLVNLCASLNNQIKCHLLWKLFPSELLGIPEGLV